MAVPKHQTSKARRAKRRAHHKLSLPTYNLCPNCSAPKLPYHICPSCGFYGHRPILQR